ncbi:MAG: permease prefix domain 1-containing protein [Oscillospiraceae bacterium]|nr:permease prefix domain 1-containing protein [Oscillospiraceae bacterium]
METIKAYLETMFSALPKTEEVLKLKNELLISMEEKYNELKAAGKSENEAVGTVISEFGNIDELTDEMGLPAGEIKNEDEIYLTRDETMHYLAVFKKSGFWIGIGVWLIMLGVALMILIGGFGNEAPAADNLGDAIGLVGDVISDAANSLLGRGEAEENDFRGAVGVFVLLMAIAGAVPLFIIYGMKLEPYEILESKEVRLDSTTRAEVELLDARFNQNFIGLIAGGIALILFAVGMFILFGVIVSDELQYVLLSLMLFLIGLAVFMFINAGMIKASYECLLNKGDYALKHKFLTGNMGKMSKIIGTAAAFFWPLVVAGYLLWSFLHDAWHISWVTFPVAGLVFGAFAGAVGAYYSLSEEKK